jgi:hypothetical protein
MRRICSNDRAAGGRGCVQIIVLGPRQTVERPTVPGEDPSAEFGAELNMLMELNVFTPGAENERFTTTNRRRGPWRTAAAHRRYCVGISCNL